MTGARGFVGSALVKDLSSKGWRVASSPMRLLQEPDKWRAAMQSVDSVVHLAARVHRMGADANDEAAFNTLNVEGSRFVAQQAANAGVRRFIFLSSVKVNGEGRERPYLPDDPPDPRDAYGRSKWAAERAIREVCDSAGMEYVAIRPPLIYGPGVKANFRRLLKLVDYGIPLPLASVANRRSMVGLSNLIDFIELCMVHPIASGGTWFVADEEAVSTPQLLRKLATHMQRPARLMRFPPAWLHKLAAALNLQGEVDRLCGSLQINSEESRAKLQWLPRHSLDEELASTVAAYRAEAMG